MPAARNKKLNNVLVVDVTQHDVPAPHVGASRIPLSIRAACLLSVLGALLQFPPAIPLTFGSGYVHSLTQKAFGSRLDSRQLDRASVVVYVATLALTLISIAGYVLVFLYLRRAHRWARIVLIILTAGSLFSLISPDVWSIITAVVSVAATVFAFRPDSQSFLARPTVAAST